MMHITRIKTRFGKLFAFLSILLAAPSTMGILFAGSINLLQPNQQADWPAIDFELVDGVYDQPLYVTHAGDGSGRLFVLEQPGRIWIVRSGAKGSAPFLDITGRVRSPGDSGGGGEQGLLGLAFPPGYAQKGYFYIYYTNLQGDNVLSRVYLTANPDAADASSEQQLLVLDHPEGTTNHNGGMLAFGPDGYLYVAVGDGNDPENPGDSAQDPGSLLGKLLRIDVEAASSAQRQAAGPLEAARQLQGEHPIYLPLIGNHSLPGSIPAGYRIPADNPFAGEAGYQEEIWAMGLRNPWRFSFDRLTGNMFLSDVGQNLYEEINIQPAGSGGQNYGWNVMEGYECYNSAACDKAPYTMPVHVYTHSSSNCSVTGGYVYRGQAFPTMQGVYFFGDFCSGMIWGLQPEGGSWAFQELADTGFLITSFGEDQNGELYVVDRQGRIYRVVAAQ